MSEPSFSLADIPAVGETRKQKLTQAGFDTVSEVASATGEELAAVKSLNTDMARCIRHGARELLNKEETVQNQIATDCDAQREAVAEAFSKIAYRGGTFEMKQRALREIFCDERANSILRLEGKSLRHLFSLYEAGFRTLGAVAEASLEDLAEINYFDKQRAQEFKQLATESIENTTDSGSTRSGEDQSGTDQTSSGGESESTPSDSGSSSATPTSDSSSDNELAIDLDDITDSRPIEETDARQLLKASVGPEATFRPHQWEAIDRLVNYNDHLLLVQRTGWGKSTVYFIATKLLRAQGGGPTLIISPLLSLMRNQIKNAGDGLNLNATTINSNNVDEWETAKEAVVEGTCDILLVSPERLANPDFRKNVFNEMESEFGMLVVDEAHCISDWGHEFRPDYRRIKPMIERLPDSIPIAATTATANDRVVDDVTNQLPNLDPVRGKLVRDSLRIQTIELTSPEQRLAWLAENVTETPVSGIIYCLTTDDTQMVADWLSQHGLDVLPYHGRLDDAIRREREQRLLDNDVDALVATNALGMGFNKPDLGFVIHFQRPPDLIRYYQEIGRAGRDLDEAYAILLAGEEDDDIAEFFIESAFPAPEDFESVLSILEDSSEPVSKQTVIDRTDIDWGPVDTSLDILSVEGAINRVDGGYVRTERSWTYDYDRVEKVTDRRWAELDRIKEFVTTDKCLTLFIDSELDGTLDEPCGQCANCAGNFLPTDVQDDSLIEQAAEQF